jgi:hypothetical protein
MYLRGGASYATAQSYSEQVDISSGNGCANGSSGNEITITNYSGEYVVLDYASGVDMIIMRRTYWILGGEGTDGSSDYYFKIDKASEWQSAIFMNADRCTVRYVEITGGYYHLIEIEDADYNVVEYSKIHTTKWTANKDTHGIHVRGDSDNGTLRHLEMYDMRGNCIEVLQDVGFEVKANWEVHDCEFYATAAAQGGTEVAIGMKGGESWSVHHNVVHGFRHCDGSTGGTGNDGEAFIVGQGGGNSEFYDNEIYDISGNAIRIDQDNVIFRNNVIYDLAYDVNTDEATVLYVTSGAQNADLHNNTIVGDYGWPTQADDKAYRSLSGATVDLKNNIFKDTGNINDSGTTAYDYNCWYNAAQTLSGANDVTSDPLFTDEGSDDYTLASNSPCIDTGVDVGQDYNGVAPDMGAFEFGQLVIANLVASAVVRTIDPTVDISAPGGPHVITPAPASAVVLTRLVVAVTIEPVVVLDGAVLVLDGGVLVIG